MKIKGRRRKTRLLFYSIDQIAWENVARIVVNQSPPNSWILIDLGFVKQNVKVVIANRLWVEFLRISTSIGIKMVRD